MKIKNVFQRIFNFFFRRKKISKVNLETANHKPIVEKNLSKPKHVPILFGSPKGWNGYTGPHMHMHRHFNKKRHGKALRRKHAKNCN